jgi:catechol 2,3-dioxygenase-like lactoylglutathione lyase family enzyme
MSTVNFRSNHCVGIKVPDIKKAREFYEHVLGFKLVENSDNQLVFDTGHFTLYVERSYSTQSPVPSFTVKKIEDAKKILIEHGCEIVDGGDKWIWFKDPFGIVYDIIEKQD